MAEEAETCKYWRYGFCSRKDNCKFAHPPEEHGLDRDPNLPETPTTGEQKSGYRVIRKRGHESSWGSEPPRQMSKGGSSESVTLEVKNIPTDASMREVTQIFRQYDGFLGCKLYNAGDSKNSTVEVADRQTAAYITDCLNGYQFDERNQATFLEVRLSAKGKGKGAVKGAMKGKGVAPKGKGK